jgi:plastocyanin
MRGLRISVYLLLMAALLGIVGCGGPAYVMKGPEVKANKVTINNCAADPDTVQVPRGDTLTWANDPADLHTYTIHFRKSKPVSSSTFPTGQGQKVDGDFACNYGGWAYENWCR